MFLNKLQGNFFCILRQRYAPAFKQLAQLNNWPFFFKNFLRIFIYFAVEWASICFFNLIIRQTFLVAYTKGVKPIFHLATLFARREAKTRIGQREWLKLAGEKIRREQSRKHSYFFVCSREQSRQVENRLKASTL